MNEYFVVPEMVLRTVAVALLIFVALLVPLALLTPVPAWVPVQGQALAEARATATAAAARESDRPASTPSDGASGVVPAAVTPVPVSMRLFYSVSVHDWDNEHIMTHQDTKGQVVVDGPG